MYKGTDEYPVDYDPKTALLNVSTPRASANTSASAPDGDVYELLGLHYVVIDEIWRIPINAYGGYMVYDPLGFSSFAPSVGPGGGSGVPIDAYQGPGPAYEVWSLTEIIFLGATDYVQPASDLTPYIDSVSPSTWDPGTTVSVLIQGEHFGPNPSLEISPDDGKVRWTNMNPSLDGKQITADFTIDTDAPPGERIVTVTSRGVSGLGFAQGPGQSSKSNGRTVKVAGSPCQIFMTNDQVYYNLDAASNYRTATIPLRANSPGCTGTVNWSLTLYYQTTHGFAAQRSGPFTRTSLLNDEVNFTSPIGIGGRGELVAEIIDSQGRTKKATATLFVHGQNPPTATVDEQLKSIGAQSYSGPTKNILTGIAAKESSYQAPGLVAGQFSKYKLTNCNGGQAIPLNPVKQGGIQGSWPTEDCASGFHVGLFQVEVTSPALAWDWLANVNQAVSTLQFHYNKAILNETTFKNQSCTGRPNRPPALTALQLEDNALAGYNAGDQMRFAYWIPSKDCKTWTVNVGARTITYVREVRSLLR
ncbi:MAG: hypothetical protein IT165_29645 [Bryobacterales bacterium]|nr:hypothetical protein [Bryobacterales bacterium]